MLFLSILRILYGIQLIALPALRFATFGGSGSDLLSQLYTDNDPRRFFAEFYDNQVGAGVQEVCDQTEHGRECRGSASSGADRRGRRRNGGDGEGAIAGATGADDEADGSAEGGNGPLPA